MKQGYQLAEHFGIRCALAPPPGYWITVGHEQKYPLETRGKFMWFSPFVTDLIDIAVAEILCGAGCAKVSSTPKGDDHVLCVYWPDNSKAQQVRERHDDHYACSSTKFVGWKSDLQTREEWRRREKHAAGA